MKPEGKLRYAAGTWVIETTPDVTVRLKRIFPRMNQAVATELTIKDTDEVANDLEWVLYRFPLEMEAQTAEQLKTRAQRHRDKLARLATITERTTPPPQFSLEFQLREYQALATELYLTQGYLLNADVVGLGKTAVGIASFTDKRTLPALVVVKAHLPKQWTSEIKKFLPNAWVHTIKQCREYKLPPADVYIITFSKLASWWGILAKTVKSVVYDEIQELRGAATEKYRAAKLLNGELAFKLGLSATPIFNYGGEIWNVVSLLNPDVLGTAEEFHREWCHYVYGKSSVVDPDALGHHLRKQNIMIRRTRKEVGRVLPPVVRHVIDAEFDQEAFKAGTSSADELARIILSGSFHERGEAARKLDLELRRATGVAKAPFNAEFIRMLVESGEQVLVGAWHRAVWDIFADRLRDLNPVFFTGHESPSKKDLSLKLFLDRKSPILGMSLRSGDGTNGIQSVCSCIVLAEMDWSPGVHEQFVGRAARDGQDESVQVYIPVAPHGSDPTMASVLGLKSAQSSGIIDLGESINDDFIDTDTQRVRQLAIDYLKARRIPIPQPQPELANV